MGITPSEFWQMSWRDYTLKQRGFFELRNQEYKSKWEQARMISYWAVKVQTGKKWPHKFTDLGRFAWEGESVKLPTKEEMRYWTLKYGKFVDDKGNCYNA